MATSASRFRVISESEYPTADEERQALAAVGAEVVRVPAHLGEDEIIAACRGADVLLTQNSRISPRVIASFDRVKGIVRYGVGYDTVDVPAATARGIVVCNVPDYGTDEVSDHAITLLLAAARKLIPMARSVQEGTWSVEPFKPIWRLRGRTLGIVGLGRIGSLAARKAQGFGLDVIAYDPYRTPEYFAERNVRPTPTLDALLSASDYVSIHTPLSDQTRHSIGEREFGLMKPAAFLVNTSRGPVVDGAALARALRTGRIAGAAIDVTEAEPIPRDSPLLGLDTCIVTPHAAWYSEEGSAALQRLAAEEAVRILLGQPPRCPVNQV
ncbi:MAG: C-terminal binding protein [Chloroflexi bacterium]|nr:C-terminal binding protein [Chloroflexota bacterium]